MNPAISLEVEPFVPHVLSPKTVFGITEEILDRGSGKIGSRVIFIEKDPLRQEQVIVSTEELGPSWPGFNIPIHLPSLTCAESSDSLYASLLAIKLKKSTETVIAQIREFYHS